MNDTRDLSSTIELACAAEQSGHFREALGLWRSVLAEKPCHMRAQLRIGLLHAQLGRYAEAERLLGIAAARWPNRIAPLRSLARLAVLSGDWSKAFEHFKEIAERDPDHPGVYHHAGNMLLRLNAYGEAEYYLKEAVRREPDNQRLRLRLTRAALAEGHFDLALSQINQMTANASSWDEARVVIEQSLEIGHLLASVTEPRRALELIRLATKHPGTPHPFPERAGDTLRAAIMDPHLGTLDGHHYNLNLFYKQFLEGLGLQCRILCTYPVPDTRLLETLDPMPYFVMQPYVDTKWISTYEIVERHNMLLFEELNDLTPQLDADVAVFHSVRITMILGIAHWLKKFFERSRGMAVIGVIEADHIDPRHPHHEIAQRLYQSAFSVLKRVENLELVVFGETPPVTRFLRSAGREEVSVDTFPYLAAYGAEMHMDEALPQSSPRKIRIGYLGATNSFRGPHLVPDVILRAQQIFESPVEWVVQLDPRRLRNIGGELATSQLEKLKTLDTVSLHSTNLSASDYYSLFSSIDILLMPYDQRYRISGSGVFIEALVLGKIPVVPRGSLMEATLLECGAHPVSIKSQTPPAVLDALRYAVTHFDRLRENILVARDHWLEHHGGRAKFEKSFLRKANRAGLDLSINAPRGDRL